MIAAPVRDADIQAEATRVLASLMPGLPLSVQVHDGVVMVGGNVATACTAANICARLRQVSGVVDVVDRIVDDDNLQRLVRATIAEQPSAGEIRKSHVVMGAVYVDWDSRDLAAEVSVREALLRVAGVRVVINGSWSRSQEVERALRRLGPIRNS
jgi:hypothetical protein